jgi:hypothetical protein
MRKGILVTLLALFTVFAMIGVVSCGGDDDGGSTPTPPAPQNVTITKDFNWPDEAVGTPPNNTSFQLVKSTGTVTATHIEDPTEAQSPADYEFLGWFTSKSAGTKVTVGKTYATNDTIWAHWEVSAAVDEAVITFNTNGGLPAIPTVKIKLALVDPDDPDSGYEPAVIPVANRPGTITKSTASFKDWKDDADNSIISDSDWATKTFGQGNHSVSAYWEVTVTFDLNYLGATGAPADITIDEGEIIPAEDWPSTPSRTGGYTFKFWSTSSVTASATAFDTTGTIDVNTDLYAIWNDPIIVTLTFDLNYPSSPANPNSIQVIAGIPIAANVLPAPTRTGYGFVEWNTSNEGVGTAIGVGHTFTNTANATVSLFAQWLQDGYARVIFQPNGGAFDFGTPGEPDLSTDPIIEDFLAGVIPSAQIPEAVWTDWVFEDWYDTASPGEDDDPIDLSTETFAVGSITPLYADWSLDLTGYVEEVTLDNSWYVVYQFTIPGGKTFANYTGVSAQYFVDQDMYDNGHCRGDRIMGNYKDSHFSFAEASSVANGGNKAVASYNAGGQAIYVGNSGSFGSDYGTKGSLGVAIASVQGKANEWFTITQNFPAAAPSTNFNPAENLPAANFVGTLYYGLGLSGQGDDGNTFLVRNVFLKGETGTTDVQGYPLVFKVTNSEPANELYPAFTGYPNVGDGSADDKPLGVGLDGFKQAKRVSIGTLEAPPVDYTFKIFDITLDYNWPTELVADQPIDGEATTQRNGTLTSDDLSTTGKVPTGYEFDKWSTTASDTPTAGSTVTANGTVFSVATTIYARWKVQTKPDPTVPLVVEGNELFSMHGTNVKATYDSVSGVATAATASGITGGGGWIGANEYALMTTGTLTTKLTGATDNLDGLSSVKFPATVNDFLYTKIIVYYEAIVPATIEGLGADTNTIEAIDRYPNGETNAAMGGNMHIGYNSWSGAGSPQYPNFDPGADKSFTWDLAGYLPATVPTNGHGFSIQFGSTSAEYPKVSGWLLKITKVVFTTQALIDGD